MQARLIELNRVVGIQGSLVCSNEGQILAQALPDSAPSEGTELAARVIAQTFQALCATGNRVTELDLVFETNRVIIRNLRGALLVLLCDRAVNLPLVNVNVNRVARKLNADLKAAQNRYAGFPGASFPGRPVPAAPADPPEDAVQPAAPAAEAQVPPSPPAPFKTKLQSRIEEQSDANAGQSRGPAAPPSAPDPLNQSGGPLTRRLKVSAGIPKQVVAVESSMSELMAFTGAAAPPAAETGDAEAEAAGMEDAGPAAEGWTEDAEDEVSRAPDAAEQQAEARRLVKAAADARLALRAIGTVGIYSHCHQPHSWLNASTGYGSLEFGGLSAQTVPLAKLMTGLGYRANGELNVFYRGRRLVFDAPGWQYRVHIFLDSVGLYQRLDVSRFLSQESFSLSPTLLLLTRLQRMDVGEDELRELSMLLLDHEFDAGKGEGDRIGLGFIKSLCGEDWGWFKTAEVNLARLREAAPAWLDGEESTRLQQRLSEMQTAIERAPKTLRWRTRALLGETIPWYHTPQEAPKAAPR